ncbi:MAG: DUF1638 domain-containing protein [Methanomassiliicoccales archaeon]|jgi:hypothetical protein
MDAEQPGRVLGIVGCEVLMNEIAHVISMDGDVSSVIVIDTPESRELAQRLEVLSPSKTVEVKAEAEAGTKVPGIGTKVIVKVMPIGLHQRKAELREEVLAQAMKMQKICGSILIFYGLCGNAFRDIERLTSDFTVPVTILRDDRSLIVDDCVGAELGGTEEYLAYLRSEHGEYPLNAMWAEKWRHYMCETQLLRDPNDLEGVKMVFQCMGYSRVAKLDTGLGNADEFEKEVREFASLLELDVVNVRCPLRVVEESYRAAMTILK